MNDRLERKIARLLSGEPVIKRKNRYERFYEYLRTLIGYDPITFVKHVESKTLVREGYMPLSIEGLEWGHPEDSEEHPCISLCHYGEQNGDAMRDPEVMFRINFEKKEAIPCYWRQDYLGIEQMIRYGYRNKSLDVFSDMWFRNLKAQGFNPLQVKDCGKAQESIQA